MRGINLNIMNDSCSILDQKGQDVPEWYADALAYELATRWDKHQNDMSEFFGEKEND